MFGINKYHILVSSTKYGVKLILLCTLYAVLCTILKEGGDRLRRGFRGQELHAEVPWGSLNTW